MAKQQLALTQSDAHVASSEFLQNLRTALLLSLLERNLLTQSQFDRCIEELKDNVAII